MLPILNAASQPDYKLDAPPFCNPCHCGQVSLTGANMYTCSEESDAQCIHIVSGMMNSAKCMNAWSILIWHDVGQQVCVVQIVRGSYLPIASTYSKGPSPTFIVLVWICVHALPTCSCDLCGMALGLSTHGSLVLLARVPVHCLVHIG